MNKKTIEVRKDGDGKNLGNVAKNNGIFSSKWTNLPIGMPYWNGGWAGGQPQLSKPAKETPFFRVDESPPPVATATKGSQKKYSPSPDRVMF